MTVFRNHLYVTAICCLLLSNAAFADPILKYNNSTLFQSAITDQSFKGVNSATDPRTPVVIETFNKIYPGQLTSLGSTFLSVNVSPLNAMITSTIQVNKKSPIIFGAVTYKKSDPDWTHFALDFTIDLPEVGAYNTSGIDELSLSVVDNSGFIKSWGWEFPAIHEDFNNFIVPLNDGAGTDGSTNFFEDSQFDITQSSMLILSYRGTLLNYPPLPVTVNPLPKPSIWTAITDFETTPADPVVPEPGTAAVACTLSTIGLYSFLLRRKR